MRRSTETRTATPARYTLTPVNATVESLEGNKVKVSVEISEIEFDKAIGAAFKRIAKEVNVPGFRPGKAPRKLLEQRVGKEAGREEALRVALPEFYAEAVIDHEVDVIAAPEIEITHGQESGPVAFTAVVEVRPSVSVAGYGGLQITLPSPVVTEEEIDTRVDRLREQHGELALVDRPAEKGDHVTIDIEGSQDGIPEPGLTAEGYMYEVGSGGVVAELDTQLLGASAGDVLSFDAPHPDPDEDEIHFEVTVQDVKAKTLPEATDQWAKDSSEFDTIAELRADTAKRLKTVKSMQATMQLRDKAAEALALLVEDEMPKALINMEAQNRLRDLEMRLQAQGASIEQYLEATGRSQEEVVAEALGVAEKMVRVDLALRALADAEAITAGDDDIDAEIENLARRNGRKPNQLRKAIEANGDIPNLRADIRKRKALEWLAEHVSLVDESGAGINRADLDISGLDVEGEDADDHHDHDHDHDHHDHDHDHDH